MHTRAHNQTFNQQIDLGNPKKVNKLTHQLTIHCPKLKTSVDSNQ